MDLAARISGLAWPAQVLMSSAVADSARQRLDADAFSQAIVWRGYGAYSLKGFDEPLEIRAAGFEGLAPFEAPAASEKAKPATTKRRTLRVGVIAAIVAVAALVAGAVYFTRPPAEDSILALPTGPKIAVLPFTNMSGDPEQEYFSDGLSEDIITKLSRFRDLFVIARNSTFQYKGRAMDVRDVARELGARYVLEGSVRRAGTSLRVTAQLLDAKDGTHLWAETYDRDLSTASIFAVQDEITEQVVATIAGFGVISQARFEEVEGKATDDLAAYECVLLAQASIRDAFVVGQGRERVRSCLERAVRDDPGYADAWAELTWVTLYEYAFGDASSPDALDEALRTAQRAVECDPNNQNALNALANVHFFRHELDRFFVEVDRAIAANPNNAMIVGWVGSRFVFAGKGERGIALTRRAMALDSHQMPTGVYDFVAAYHFQRKEYAKALAAAQKSRVPGSIWPKIYIAASYGQLDRPDEARSTVEELLSIYPGFTHETASAELRKWNFPDDVVERYLEGLRKAGVPDG